MHGAWRSCHRDGRARPSAPRHGDIRRRRGRHASGIFMCLAAYDPASGKARRRESCVAGSRGQLLTHAVSANVKPDSPLREWARRIVRKRAARSHDAFRFATVSSLARCRGVAVLGLGRRRVARRRCGVVRAPDRCSVCTRRSHAISAQANLPVAATTTGPDLPARQLAREQSQGRAPTHGTTRSRRAVLDLFGVPFTGMRTKHR